VANYLDQVSAYLDTHYAEAADGLVEKLPSRLCRGEGTERNFYILKIDLVRSTQLLYRRRSSTYLKLAHTFLSTVDRIVGDYGADRKQTEYAGDSVLAYFPDSVSALDVLAASCYCRAAVKRIGKLDQTLASINIQCKIALHYAPLIVSNIGPRGESVLTAIGHPIHVVAKLEKDVPENAGRATVPFHDQLVKPGRKYLSAIYSEANPPVLPRIEPTFPDSRVSLLASLLDPQPQSPVPQTILGLAAALRHPASGGLGGGLTVLGAAAAYQPQPQVNKTVKGYRINWGFLYPDLGIPAGG
jgi:class 3 adenylate cyclase